MNPHFIKTLLLIFTLTISIVSFSQKSILPGYVISLDGDTLKGYINYGNWEMSPKSIDFSANTDGESVSYNASEIKEFSVSNEIYMRAIVSIDKSTNNTQNLLRISTFEYRTDTAFIQTLMKGTKSLYYYQDRNMKKHFFIQSDSGFIWLKYKNYLKKDAIGNEKKVTNKTFIGQLTVYLNDCPQVISTINNAAYSKESLMGLFSDYYDCTGQSNEINRTDKDKKTRIGVLAGMTLTNVVFRSDSPNILFDIDYSSSKSLALGMKMDFVISGGRNKWSLDNEFLITNYLVKGYYEEYQNENYYETGEVSIGYTHFRLSNMIRFTQALNKLSFFTNAGITNGLAISKTDQVKIESVFYSTTSVRHQEAFGNMSSWEFGLNMGMGIKWKKLSFEYRYERGSSFLGSKSTATHRNYFLLGYTF